VEQGDDVAEVTSRAADDRGTTYIFMGQPRPRRGMRRFEEALPEQLIRKLPGIDLRIVADAR
jgi:two-component system, OmpR family, sensor histidine kinase KdpD